MEFGGGRLALSWKGRKKLPARRKAESGGAAAAGTGRKVKRRKDLYDEENRVNEA